MKCVRAENPPCVRCTKTGRQCIIPDSNRPQQASAIHSSARSLSEFKAPSAAPIPYTYPNHAGISAAVKHHVRHVSRLSIGRSYTTPSLVAAPNVQSLPSGARWLPATTSTGGVPPPPTFDYNATNIGHVQDRSDLGARPDSDGQSNNSECESTLKVPNDEELCHMIRFFIVNMLVQIPVLSELEVSDLAITVRSKRLLAYSMAYVAARFVPGCRAIRTMLTPTVLCISRLQLDELNQPDRVDENRWTLLQALAVLYNWAPPQSAVGDENSQFEPNQEMLRLAIETLTSRYSLHMSAKEVADLSKSGAENVYHTFAFHKYLYWLWLFTLAHFRSLISQTPPSIREDATITAAAQILESKTLDSRVRSILARVELCLLWLRAGLRERGLGEWWCVFRNQVDTSSTLAILSDLDAALQLWHRTWGPAEKQFHFDRTAKPAREGAIEFYYHFTRFCIARYVAEVFQPSSSAESLQLSTVNLVMKATERASTFCRFFLERSPLLKSSIRFSPEIIFAMVASSCDYLIQVSSSSGELNHGQPAHMSVVGGVAELLADLGADDKHVAKVYGQSLLAKVEVTQPAEPTQKLQKTSASHRRSNTWAGTRSNPQRAQALVSFAGVTDDTWSIQGNLGQRGLLNGEQAGIAMNSNDGSGLWTMNYQGGEGLVSNGSYWTS